MSDIPSRETGVAELKRIHLRADGMEPVGWIFIEPDTGRRATLDYWGRVQWWDVDGSGRMHAESARVAELEAEHDSFREALKNGADSFSKVLWENKRLRTALHDAIDRPKGVVPDSAESFYEPMRCLQAEADTRITP